MIIDRILCRNYRHFALLAHAFLNGNCNGNGCAYHGVVAQRKIAIFIVLIRLKKCPFLSKIGAFWVKILRFCLLSCLYVLMRFYLKC